MEWICHALELEVLSLARALDISKSVPEIIYVYIVGENCDSFRSLWNGNGVGEASFAAREMYAKQTMIYAVINVHSEILFGTVVLRKELV